MFGAAAHASSDIMVLLLHRDAETATIEFISVADLGTLSRLEILYLYKTLVDSRWTYILRTTDDTRDLIHRA
jgi:hypothetical protein